MIIGFQKAYADKGDPHILFRNCPLLIFRTSNLLSLTLALSEVSERSEEIWAGGERQSEPEPDNVRVSGSCRRQFPRRASEAPLHRA